MNSMSRIVASIILLVVSVGAQPGFANVIYTYTGSNFTDVVDDPSIPGSYNTSMRISGTLELSSPLLPNRSVLDAAVIPLSFSFGDGRSVITNTSPRVTPPTFQIATDATGNITEWNISIYLESGFAQFHIRTLSSQVFGSSHDDQGSYRLDIRTINTDYAYNRSVRGSWTMTGVAMPHFPPSSLAPFSISSLTPYLLDPTKPTVIITHGWQPFPFSTYNGVPPDWVSQMASRIHGLGANVVTPVWRGAFTATPSASALTGAAAEVANQGRLLADALLADPALASILRRSGGVHFIGHSLGSLVNAYAANALVQQGIHIDQFTILDRPFGQGIRPQDIFIPVQFDADGPIFRTLLRQGDVTWVDNYYGTDVSTLPPATGAGLLPALAFNQDYSGANHVGVHEHYYATIPATRLRTPTCPVDGGFLCSIVGGGFEQRRPFDWDPRLESNPLSVPANPLPINLVDWRVFNCQIANNAAACTEGSPAYLWMPSFQVKANELFLSFDFQWTNTGDGDWLTLHFGDQLLFSFAGTAFKGLDFIRALIPIGQFAGQMNQLLFTLHNAGDANAAINIRNIERTTSISVAIDIKPGGTPNSINVKPQGTIPVAVLSTTTFNAPVRIAPGSLTFGRTGNESSLKFCNQTGEDVNGDRLPDLVCHFDTAKTGFQLGDTNGILNGLTPDGAPVIGTDSVHIVR